MKQLNAGSVARVAGTSADGLHDFRVEDVRIRPYAIDDAGRLNGMSQRLSKQSLYRRFFSGTPRIPELYVRQLQGMDHWDHDALVALYDGEMVGIAEYVRHRGDRRLAELAVLISDPWQRHGLARLLVGCLIPVAARRGITGFRAEVMSDNAGATRAVHSGWPSIRPERSEGHAMYELPLPLPAPAPAPVPVPMSVPVPVPVPVSAPPG